MSHLQPMNHMKGIPTNSIFVLQTRVSWRICLWYLRDICAFVSPQNHANESPQANDSNERDLNEFYFRTSNTCFVRNILMMFYGYVYVCFTSKSCKWVTSSQWIIRRGFRWIPFSHYKKKFRVQHSNDFWGICVHLFHLEIMLMTHLNPINHMKGIRTNSNFALQTWVSCTTC